MPAGLVRSQQSGDNHFITFSCYHRRPYLSSPSDRELFEEVLERMRRRYRCVVFGYVVMPEHVHLLVNEPKRAPLDRMLQALKLSITWKRNQRPFGQARYYDFNVHTEAKRIEKLRYMHRNPVVRGLVTRPQDWPWSSYRHYATGIEGTVEIESFWTGWRREHGSVPPMSQPQGHGAPILIQE